MLLKLSVTTLWLFDEQVYAELHPGHLGCSKLEKLFNQSMNFEVQN